MYFSIIVSVISIILMMICIIIKPSIKIGNKEYSTFYIPILLGAIILLVNPSFDKSALINIVFSNSKLNPIKILILFISFSFLSVSLDESGFFASAGVCLPASGRLLRIGEGYRRALGDKTCFCRL